MEGDHAYASLLSTWERSLHLEPGTAWFGTDDGRLDAICGLDVMNCLENKAGLKLLHPEES